MNHKSWWKNKYDGICAITGCRLRSGKNKKGQTYIVRLNCNHSFYRSALLKWIEQGKNTCPLCRVCFKL